MTTAVATRKMPWQVLGKMMNYAEGATTIEADTDAHPMTSAEMLQYAGLDWTMWNEPLVATAGHGTSEPMTAAHPYLRSTWRTDGDNAPILLGVVGSDHVTHQIDEAFGLLDNLRDGIEGALFVQAGYKGRGEEVFAVVKDPTPLVLDPGGRHDVTERYYFAHTGTVGNAATTIRPIGERLFCTNQIPGIIRNRRGSMIEAMYKCRHTGATLLDRADDARRALGLADEAFATMESLGTDLIRRPVTDAQYEGMIVRFIGEAPTAERQRALTAWNTRRDGLWGTYRGANNANVTGTAWGAYHAMTEWAEWERPVRANGGDLDVARANSSMSTNATAARMRALEVVLG